MIFYRKKPEKIQIEITNRCNLDCLMCPRGFLKLEHADMPLFVFRSVLNKINSPAEVILTGWGEPMLVLDIFEMIKECKKRRFITGLTTNGTLLSEENSQQLVASGIDTVTISVDSLGKLTEADPRHKHASIKENINNIVRARSKSPALKIIIQSTLHKGKENDIYEIIKQSKGLGVDAVKIIRLDRRFNKELRVFSKKDEKMIAKGIKKLSKNVGMRVDMMPYFGFTGIRRISWILLSSLWMFFTKKCPKTLGYLYITNDGKATPCCGLPRQIIGDLLTSTLAEVWEGDAMREFRKKQQLICKGCEVFMN